MAVVSRDFSRTKARPDLDEHLEGLIEILTRADREFHVLAIGIGHGSAGYVFRALARIGTTCTIITADPIVTAASHHLYVLGPAGIIDTPVDEDPPELALLNLRTLECYLNRITNDLPLYRDRPRPSLWLPRALDDPFPDRPPAWRIDRRSA